MGGRSGRGNGGEERRVEERECNDMFACVGSDTAGVR